MNKVKTSQSGKESARFKQRRIHRSTTLKSLTIIPSDEEWKRLKEKGVVRAEPFVEGGKGTANRDRTRHCVQDKWIK